MAEKALKIRVCPVCKNTYIAYPAISRKDNKTEICPICGLIEALEDYYFHNTHKEEHKEEQK